MEIRGEGGGGGMDRQRIPRGDSRTASFRDLMSGLDLLWPDFGRIEGDFVRIAVRIARDPDAPAVLRHMMIFAAEYHQFGLRPALRVVNRVSDGVAVDVLLGEDGKGVWTIDGILVGLVGIRRVGRQGIYDGEGVFDGIADLGGGTGEQFGVVSIRGNEETWLHPDQYDYSRPDRISQRPVEEVCPPLWRPEGQ